MSDANQLCSLCDHSLPALYCTCSPLKLYLCDGCFPVHRQKYPRLAHTTIPLEVSDAAGYQERCQVFAAGRSELMRNLSEIEKCCSEVNDAVEATITRIQKYRDEFIDQMTTWKSKFKSEIEFCISEVEASLVYEAVELTGPYSLSLRHYTPGSLHMFTYEVKSEALERWMSSLVTTDFHPPRPYQIQEFRDLYWVTESSLHWFDVTTLQLHPPVQLSSRLPITNNSRWTVLDSDKVCICGGGLNHEELASAYIVSKTGNVTVLPDMQYGHNSPGVLVWLNRLYVFGSYNSKGAIECEFLYLPHKNHWKSIPQMHFQRSCFTPVVWNNSIYLCGGIENNPSIESYDGFKMHLLGLKLPESTCTFAYSTEETLLILTYNYSITLFKQGKEVGSRLKQRYGEAILLYTPPVVWKEGIYSISEREIRKHSVETGNRIE